MQRNEESLRDLWDNIKCTNIRIRGLTEEKREKGLGKIFQEIISENLLNIGKEIVNQVQEAEIPSRINPKRNTPRHIVIKPTKIKRQIKY